MKTLTNFFSRTTLVVGLSFLLAGFLPTQAQNLLFPEHTQFSIRIEAIIDTTYNIEGMVVYPEQDDIILEIGNNEINVKNATKNDLIKAIQTLIGSQFLSSVRYYNQIEYIRAYLRE